MPRQMRVPLFQVDAFTNGPFAGNPAAVCLLDEGIPNSVMLQIAAEMNLSETAFVQPPNPHGLRRLQWFTPKTEVPLCGHATLATSHVLLREMGEVPPLQFQTLSGILAVEESADGWIQMDFPADPPTAALPPTGLLKALGCPAGSAAAVGEKLWLVRVDSEAQVRALDPDMTSLARVDLGSTPLGVSVTAPGAHGVDFVSRFFGPWVGVDEDPVTGMAHTILGPYWMDELGRENLTARQISKRGGALRVGREGGRILISGEAVTVVRGTLFLPG